MSAGEVGPRLKKKRQEQGLTQADLAARVGLDQTLISKMENGKAGMTPEIAEALATFFGVRAGWLLFGEGEAPPDADAAYRDGRRQALQQMGGVVDGLLAELDGVNHRVAKDAAAREADAKVRGGRGAKAREG